MKATFSEYAEFIHIDFTPENSADVCALVRLQINSTKQISEISTFPSKANGVATSLVIRRPKRERYTIQ